ncbi:MAG: acyl-coenzyme A thioesterase PaaI-like protein [Algoriphagus sp.]
MGITFDGYSGVLFDIVLGPFSTFAAKAPRTTLDLNICFIKSVSQEDEMVLVETKGVGLSKINCYYLLKPGSFLAN